MEEIKRVEKLIDLGIGKGSGGTEEIRPADTNRVQQSHTSGDEPPGPPTN